jgi:thiamine biosynthesis lipoprotein
VFIKTYKDNFFYSKFVPKPPLYMKYSKSCHNFILLFATTLFLSASCKKGAEYRYIEGFTQGTTYHIVYSADIDDSLDTFVQRKLLDIDSSLSVYNPSSVISRINRNEEVAADSLFINVFNRSRKIYEMSGGAFDISGAPLFDIWGFGLKNRESVTKEHIDSILSFVGMDKVCLKGGRVVKDDNRTTLNVNAIAQGYSSDVIAGEFDRLGIKNYLVEIGGEIFCKGLNPRGKEWTVGIDKPVEGNILPGNDLQDILEVSGKGLATSGNYRNFYEENGIKYSHTIDPRSGYPVRHSLLSATVIAPDAMTADALATFFMVAGLDEAEKFLASNPQFDAYLVFSGVNGKFEVFKTKGVKVVKQ